MSRRNRPRKVPAISTQGIELDYLKDLLTLVTEVRKLWDQLVGPPLLRTIKRAALELDSNEEVISAAKKVERLVDVRLQGVVGKLVNRTFDRADRHNIAGVTLQFEHLGLDATAEPATRARAKQFEKENVSLIKALTGDMAKRMRAIVDDGLREGISARVMSSRITEETGISKRRAALIARDQMGTLNSKLTQDRYTAAGIVKAIWRDSGDDRVRDDHLANNGEEFIIERGIRGEIPGEPINCRCTMEPVI